MLKCKFDWKIQDYWRRLTKPRIKKGYNNKFKVLKRIVYGRSGLVNLEKKCKLAFLPRDRDFSLSALLKNKGLVLK